MESGSSRGRPLALALGVLLAATGTAQEQETLVPLHEARAIRLPRGAWLAQGTKVGQEHLDFLRRLRRVPLLVPEGEPSGLLMDRFLHRPSKAVKLPLCYLESDWMKPEIMLHAASIGSHAAAIAAGLFGQPASRPSASVMLKTEEDYLAFVDAAQPEERMRRSARSLGGTYVGTLRIAWSADAAGALRLAVSDLVNAHLPISLKAHTFLSESLHAYLTGWVCNEYTTYVDPDVTTGHQRGRLALPQLRKLGRAFLERPGRDSLRDLLATELNLMTNERLGAGLILVQFLLDEQREAWPSFLRVLEEESREEGRLKEPAGRRAALRRAFTEGIALNVDELDAALTAFARRAVPEPEEFARLAGAEAATDPPIWEGFLKICELRRAGKPVSERGRRIYEQVLRRADELVLNRGERF